jgi:hypothetical protein
MGLRLLRVAGGRIVEEWSAWETVDAGDGGLGVDE